MRLRRVDSVAPSIYCTASKRRRRNRERGSASHRFTLASSLIFQTISSMQALASSLESCPSTGDRRRRMAVTPPAQEPSAHSVEDPPEARSCPALLAQPLPAL